MPGMPECTYQNPERSKLDDHQSYEYAIIVHIGIKTLKLY